ncbi:hypothetical protein [Bacillus infantis]|uniref:hypothetical protein n=1 Tax=Bacillus infantis TaxID=324767 RepID=UPI00209C9B33|nr:hypothetical protein [Bacillus infantis]MCP1159301.1 hypothetical protein [Bacillus infantis]
MISKDEYVLDRVRVFVSRYLKENKNIKPLVLDDLIDQWSFDYEMEKEFRPHVLHK